jgi:3',5'-cyclic AMP phosphodiesterase CpdA
LDSFASVLQVSDLHFIEKFTERGKHLWLKVPPKFRGGMLEHLFGGSKSHSFAKAAALAHKVEELRFLGRDFGVLLATGDLSTDGSPSALNTAREFVEESDIHRGMPCRRVSAGLGFPATKRIVLPGNHDRYRSRYWPFQRASSALEDVFELSGRYPYIVGYRDANQREDVNVPALIFFVFDSTPSIVAADDWRWSYRRRPAVGRIEPSERDWLDLESRRVATLTSVPGLDGAPLPIRGDRVVRVVLVHHHPVPVKRDGFNPFTIMEDHEEFVAACRTARADVVLFGHEHVCYPNPKTRTPGTPHFLACPTGTEFTGPDTGFYVLSFGTDGFERETYMWNGATFVDAGATFHPYVIR